VPTDLIAFGSGDDASIVSAHLNRLCSAEVPTDLIAFGSGDDASIVSAHLNRL